MIVKMRWNFKKIIWLFRRINTNYMMTPNAIAREDTGATPVTSTINTFFKCAYGGCARNRQILNDLLESNSWQTLNANLNANDNNFALAA